VKVDDPRLDPVMAVCARLKVPVLIHTGDPAPFWLPQDKYNERWLELKEMPGRVRPTDKFPPWEVIIAEQHRLFKKNPAPASLTPTINTQATGHTRCAR
jgi:hypothetical protein